MNVEPHAVVRFGARRNLKKWRSGAVRMALTICLGGFLGIATLAPIAAEAATGARLPSVGRQEISFPVNKSHVLDLPDAFKEVIVGNPAVADVMPVTNRSVYLIGKEVGSTNLILYGANKRLISVFDLYVTPDTQTLKRRLFELLPNEKIEVRAIGESIVLSGVISQAGVAKQATDLAEQVAPERVISMLEVGGSQQVMLAVRFAEVKRSVLKQLGVANRVSPTNVPAGDAAIDFLSGTFDPAQFVAPAGAFSGIGAAFEVGEYTIDTALGVLESKGVVTTLAEPNLIAMSGETANFLAGGEFPIPVASGTDATGIARITVEFKEFGVSLAFTPTVISENLINLVVAPEVSAIDTSTSVTSNGISVPGLVTRRAQTVVELRHGQSFAIAGLLQKDFNDTVEQFPGLADVPIIGALLRNSQYERGENELVIIVTPYLVKPSDANELSTPADTFAPPSEFELMLLGRVESQMLTTGDGASVRFSTKAPTPAYAGQNKGGFDGSYGHVVY